LAQKHNRRPLLSFLFIPSLVLLAAIAAPWYRFYFASHIIEAKIVALETLEDCNPGFGPMLSYRSSGIGHYQEKSKSDAAAFLGHCGGVQTDSGQYHLVGSYQIYGPNLKRSELLASLDVGCTYSLRVVGPGSRQDQKRPGELILRQSIWAVEDKMYCD